MKVIPILLLTFVSACAHNRWACGDLLEFRDVDGTTEEFSANFRDGRLLRSDVELFGTTHDRIRTDGQRPGFMISATLDSKEQFEAMEIAVEHGALGTEGFSRNVLYSTPRTFVGKASIVSVEGEGIIRDSRLILNFKRAGEWFRLELAIAPLLKKRPNKAPEPTPTSVTPRAGARVAPAAVVAHL